MTLTLKVFPRNESDRLTELEGAIRSYDAGFDFNEVRTALNLLRPKGKLSKTYRALDDLFADPLLIVENLVSQAKADRETILSSILYPFVRPLRSDELPDKEKIENIGQLFGRGVRSTIENTLRLRALKFVEPVFFDKTLTQPEKKQQREENLRLFRMMGLWVARGPRAILIYGTQLSLNLQHEISDRGTFKQDKLNYMVRAAQYFIAPLAYIAGYEKLRETLLDLCFQVEDPVGYSKTRRVIDDAIRKRETEAVKQAIINKMFDKFPDWHEGIDYEVEIRPKPAASAHDKAKRKGQTVDELGDLCGMRIILKKSVIEGFSEADLRTLKERDRRQLYDSLGETCLRTYGELSKAFGRGNRQRSDAKQVVKEDVPQTNPDGTPKMEWFSYIQERFSDLAINESRLEDPGRYDEDPERKEWEEKKYGKIKDARFDDYINRVKASGYSAVQDTFFVPVEGRLKPIEVECQIVDELRHDHNMNGSRAGRIYYKTGLASRALEVIDWRKRTHRAHEVMAWNTMARASLSDRQRRFSWERTYVVGPGNQVFDISENPTLGKALDVMGSKQSSAQLYDGFDYPASPTCYDRRTKLMSGCRVMPVRELAL